MDPAKTPDEPPAVDWTNVVEAPSSGPEPFRRPVEMNVVKALEVGAVGGGVLGVAAAFAGIIESMGIWQSAAIGSIGGAIVWTLCSFGVCSTAGARGVGLAVLGGALRLVYSLTILAYAVALIVVIGFVIRAKLMQQQAPPEPAYNEPAKVH